MIRSAILLVRSSLVSVLFLTAALLTLGSVLFDDLGGSDDGSTDTLPALTPVSRPKPDRAGAAARHTAMFDPARRAETVSGSIDDLKPRSGTDAVQAPVSIAGVLLEGTLRKAMFTIGSEAPVWSVVGADVGGWRIASIDAEGAVIERDGETVVLKIAERYKLRAKSAAPPLPNQPDTHDGEPSPDPAPPPDATGQPTP